jgi:hypothetical protein
LKKTNQYLRPPLSPYDRDIQRNVRLWKVANKNPLLFPCNRGNTMGSKIMEGIF